MQSSKLLLMKFLVVVLLFLQGCGEDVVKKSFGANSSHSAFKLLRNQDSAKLMHVDELKLTGKGVKVGIIEWGGLVNDKHIEFQLKNNKSKIIQKTGGQIDYHATHVAGTICASGIYPQAKGIAPDATIYSYALQSNDMKNYYYAKGALYAYSYDNIFLTNNSYGKIAGSEVHTYKNDALLEDKLIYLINNNILMFKSSGNDRLNKNNAIRNYYGTTKSPANAKNIFIIGNILDNKKINPTSDVGPTPSGRLKPDLVANGTTLWSPSSKYHDTHDTNRTNKMYLPGHKNDDDYYYKQLSGTSMATPSATGVAALLIEQYEKNNGTQRIRADELKAILVNTAEDLGNEGPDYVYGFGLINAKAAVGVVKSMSSTQTSLVRKGVLSSYEIDSYLFQIDHDQTKFKATISWIDKPGEKLVNDLDIKIIGKNGKVYQSYTLDKDHPTKVATKNGNHIDNTEQIEANLAKGDYTLEVYAHSLDSNKPQKYTLVINQPVQKNDYNYVLDKDGYFKMTKYPETIAKLKELIQGYKEKKMLPQESTNPSKWTNADADAMATIATELSNKIDSGEAVFKGRKYNGYVYYLVKTQNPTIYFFYFAKMNDSMKESLKGYGLGQNSVFLISALGKHYYLGSVVYK